MNSCSESRGRTMSVYLKQSTYCGLDQLRRRRVDDGDGSKKERETKRQTQRAKGLTVFAV